MKVLGNVSLHQRVVEIHSLHLGAIEEQVASPIVAGDENVTAHWRSAAIDRDGVLMTRHLFCVLLLLYCLSLGPAEWLRIHGHVDYAMVIAVYALTLSARKKPTTPVAG